MIKEMKQFQAGRLRIVKADPPAGITSFPALPPFYTNLPVFMASCRFCTLNFGLYILLAIFFTQV